MKQLPQISDSELVLMQVIWARGGSALFAQVMETLEAQGRPWKANTVLTFLSRLAEKGYLAVNKQGRRNQYVARVGAQEYAQAQTQTLLDRVYAGSARGLVAALVQQNRLTAEDVEALRRHWEEGAK